MHLKKLVSFGLLHNKSHRDILSRHFCLLSRVRCVDVRICQGWDFHQMYSLRCSHTTGPLRVVLQQKGESEAEWRYSGGLLLISYDKKHVKIYTQNIITFDTCSWSLPSKWCCLWKAVEPSGDGASLEEVGRWGWGLGGFITGHHFLFLPCFLRMQTD